MTQEAHTPIVVWEVTGWTNATPQRKEYAKETAHFYVRNDGRRDAKISRYYQFFATQEEAQAECDRRAAAKHDVAERERRIVACVNALAGIPIEAIEGGVVAEALLAVVNATRAYLPPDGISEHECINRILEATDNPKINPVIAAWEASK